MKEKERGRVCECASVCVRHLCVCGGGGGMLVCELLHEDTQQKEKQQLNLVLFVSRHISMPSLFMVKALSVADRHR